MLFRSASFLALLFSTLVPVAAQESPIPAPVFNPNSKIAVPWAALGFHPVLPGCNASEIISAPTLSLRQRGCYYGNRLIAPSAMFHAVFSSGFSQLRNSPYVVDEDFDDVGRRVGFFYTRQSARFAGEFIAGYLNHEDPRPHVSNRTGIWNRSRGALLSVIVTEDATGKSRPALVPIAGALSSGFVGVACYGHSNTGEDGLRRAGMSYGGYFASAMFREFKPELLSLAAKILKRK